MYNFGLKLKELRKKHNLTQGKLGEKLSLSESTINKYENGTALPQFETMRSIATIFNVSMDELYGTQPKGILSLYGISEQQIKILQELTELFRNDNISVQKNLSSQQYAVLGEIVTEFLK